jgi:hypothetical protein
MKIRYLILRFIRHFLPDKWVVFLKNRNLIIQPGLETSSPQKAVEQYLHELERQRISVRKKKIMVFGYGGNLAIGCEFIKAGAGKVFLCEQKGFSMDFNNEKLSSKYPGCFQSPTGKVFADPQKIIIYHLDLNEIMTQPTFEKVDLVVSNSVFEHLKDPEMITSQLAQMTKPMGSQLHFIDLRDHYFKYPFEMLCYREQTWNNWLNPTSHLNRLRTGDYRNIFSAAFQEVKIVTDAHDLDNFLLVRPRIIKDFLSGNDIEDSTTLIHILASNPLT